MPGTKIDILTLITKLQIGSPLSAL